MPATAVSRAMGLLDVAVAFALVATGVYIVSAKLPTTPENNRRAIAWYKVTGTVPLVLLVVFFIAGSRVRWEILLTGLCVARMAPDAFAAGDACIGPTGQPPLKLPWSAEALAKVEVGPTADAKERDS